MRGWGFPMFLLFTLILSVLFATVSTIVINFVNSKLTELPYNTYNIGIFNFLAIELITLIAVGAAYTRKTIELHREMRRQIRLKLIRQMRETEIKADAVLTVVTPKPKHLIIKVEGRHFRIAIEDIVGCRADNNKVMIYLKDKTVYNPRKTLCNMEELPSRRGAGFPSAQSQLGSFRG